MKKTEIKENLTGKVVKECEVIYEPTQLSKKQPTPQNESLALNDYASQRQSVEQMIMTAIKQGVAIDTMERILAMRNQLKAEYAKEQFIQAMSNFQAECPEIKKTKQVLERNGKLRYSYAPIDSIIAQVKEAIKKNGLSYSLNTTSDEKNLTAKCRVSHIAGHSEESSFIVPLGHEEYMTDVQKFGARSTFAKRYAFCDAFGIVTGDQDTDGGEKENPAEVESILKDLENCTKDEQVVILWNSLPKQLKSNPLVINKTKEMRTLIAQAKKYEKEM